LLWEKGWIAFLFLPEKLKVTKGELFIS